MFSIGSSVFHLVSGVVLLAVTITNIALICTDSARDPETNRSWRNWSIVTGYLGLYTCMALMSIPIFVLIRQDFTVLMLAIPLLSTGLLLLIRIGDISRTFSEKTVALLTGFTAGLLTGYTLVAAGGTVLNYLQLFA